MSRIKAIGPCVVVVLILSALAASSASARSPEWMTCYKVTKSGGTYSGHYTNKACTSAVETGGMFELGTLEHLKKDRVIAASGKVTLRTPSIAVEVACKSSKWTGTVKFWTSFWWIEISGLASSCTSAGKVCTSEGQKAGRIAIDDLMGWTEPRTPTEPGVLLTPVEGAMASYDCEGTTVTATGSVLARIRGDVNTISKTAEWVFGVTGGGEQEFTTYEGGTESHSIMSEINGAGPFASSMETELDVKTEAMEVQT
jgi:hypothetical protein